MQTGGMALAAMFLAAGCSRDGDSKPKAPAAPAAKVTTKPVTAAPESDIERSNGRSETVTSETDAKPKEPPTPPAQPSEPAKAIVAEIEALGLPISIDPRVELMCVIARIAGFEEYNQGAIKAYNNDVDRHFQPFRDHPAIKAAQAMRGRMGLGYDKVMLIAINIDNMADIASRQPLDKPWPGYESRWTPEAATGVRLLFDAIRDFVTATDFNGFFRDHHDLYETTVTRMHAMLAKNLELDWFNAFFGTEPGAEFKLVVGPLNGPANYGPRIRHEGGTDELYAIIGAWRADADGLPHFDTSMVETVVHEFTHSYVNHVVEKYRGPLKEPCSKLYGRVADAMQRMAYGNWKTMIDESLVRASVIRYTASHGTTQQVDQLIKNEQANKFLWMGGLVKLLATYETQRETYPTFESFMPEVVRFFGEDE